MFLFSSILRSRQREHEARPPLPPRPGQLAIPAKVGVPADTPSSSIEQEWGGGTESESDIPAYDGFESLCKRVEEQLHELQSLRPAYQAAVTTISELQSQQAQTIVERQRVIDANQSQIRALSVQLKDATAQAKQLRGEKDQVIANLQAELHRQQEAFAKREEEQRVKEKKLKHEIQASSKALARTEQALEEQRVLCGQVAQRAEEAHRLPKGILRSSFAARFVQPFVLLLIDGDAYKFTRDLTQDHLHGGARAAHRIKTEVLNYMVNHGEIPLHSKIVVRVFFNAGSHYGKLGKDGLRSTPTVHTFMIQFSETHPLFDFLDCGSGRERADTKIKQNFELFVDNPYCRAMFLAVCYDAGFVRMLEPYQYSEDALNKIVLIRAGQVAPEFLSVPMFKVTEFTSVFQELYSLKIGPIGRTLCCTNELNPPERQGEPDDLPIGDVPDAPWKHLGSFVHPTTTLVGLSHEATLLSVKGRGALLTPELIALHISSFQPCGENGSTEAPRKADEKRGNHWRIKALENAIQQKQLAATQSGISKKRRKSLRQAARGLEEELAQLKR